MSKLYQITIKLWWDMFLYAGGESPAGEHGGETQTAVASSSSANQYLLSPWTKQAYFHRRAITHSKGIMLHECSVDRWYVKWNRSTQVPFHGWIIYIKWRGTTSLPLVSNSLPNQSNGYLSFPLLPRPALLEYILIFSAMWLAYCGGEQSQRGWQGRRRCLPLTALQFPPHLISTRLHTTREREREDDDNEGESHSEWKWPLWKRSGENGPPPKCGFIGDGGIKRAWRCNSKGY